MKLRAIVTAAAALLYASARAQSVTTNQTDNALIPDYVPGYPSPVTESINLGGTGIADITSISVTLDIAAGDGGIPWNGDYYVYLQHGSDFSVLLNRVGVTDASNPNDVGYGDPGLDVTLSDSGSDIHNYQSGAYGTNSDGQLTGVWGPDGRNSNPQTVLASDPRTALLNVFDGSGADGTWTLFVEDESAGDYGVLEGWGLDINGTSSATVPDTSNEWLLLSLSGLALVWLARRSPSSTRAYITVPGR